MANILYDQCFNSSYRTHVIEVKEENNLYWHLLEETIFYCESGGMESDEGLINQHRVLKLKNEKGKVWHLLDVELKEKVELSIDYHLRLHHAQIHTAQHLISGIIESLYGCDTIAHHIHAKYNDIEFNKEILSKHQVSELQVILNGLIRDDLPVKILYPLQRELHQYTKKDVSQYDEVRIVSIGKISAQPCGCIHVPTLRYLQMIKILEVEKSSKGFKLKYVCGDQLLNNYETYYQQLNKVGQLLAQPFEYVEVGVLKLMQEVKNLEADTQVLKQRYVEAICSTLPKENKLYRIFSDMDLKTFMLLCNTFKSQFDGLFIFTWLSQERVQVFVGNKENSDGIFKQIADTFNFQGGGNSKLCQGGGKMNADLDAYILNLLKQMK